MTRLFASYLVVDWSAAAVPRQGADSIWYALLRDGRFATVANPPTRHAAEAALARLLAAELGAGRPTLVGFDFPFGYSEGFARRLGHADWRGVWRDIAARLRDEPDNDNDRFELAAALNARVSGRGFPFWGCPAARQCPTLTMTKPGYPAEGIAEKRLIEHRVSGPQPVWKLAGVGSVGSQALTGIPVVARLRERFPQSRIWPFETGLAAAAAPIVFAEVYPSLVRPDPVAPKDKGQVRALARHFAALDEAGALARLFAGDPALSADERRVVEREEAWILGVADRARRSR